LYGTRFPPKEGDLVRSIDILATAVALTSFLRKNSVGAMIYEPVALRRYGKVSVSERANDVTCFFFLLLFYSMPLRDIFTVLHATSMFLYFDEIRTYHFLKPSIFKYDEREAVKAHVIK